MAELIAIRETARRLGVSDTAVQKAIRAGRVFVHSRNPQNNRPLMAWPQVRDDWIANSTAAKRSHVGSRGAPDRADERPEVPLVTSNRMDEQKVPGEAVSKSGPGYAQSRAVREAYMARLAKLEFEERSGKLVEIEKVKASAFKVARTIRDGLLNMPDRVAAELAHETDPVMVHQLLTAEIRTTLEALAQPSLA